MMKMKMNKYPNKIFATATSPNSGIYSTNRFVHSKFDNVEYVRKEVSTDCEYCKEVEQGDEESFGETPYGWIRGSVLHIAFDDWGANYVVSEIPIKYCPFCGRKLKKD